MVARPRSPDGNNVAITIKVSDRVAEALDAARGELSRSEWARGTITAALDGSLMTPPQALGYAQALRTASPIPFSKAPEIIAEMSAPATKPAPVAAELAGIPLTVASALPKPRRCTHPGKRSVGGYCKECDHLIQPGGTWA